MDKQFFQVSPIQVVILVNSILALGTVAFSLALWLTAFTIKIEQAEERFEARKNEFFVLQRDFGECENILSGSVQAPVYVERARIACQNQGGKFDNTTEEVDRRAKRFKKLQYYYKQTELDNLLVVYRDSVVLLKELCSEIRLRQQLVEMTAAMSRLTELADPIPQATENDLYRFETTGPSCGPLTTPQPTNSLQLGLLSRQRKEIIGQTLQSMLKPLEVHKYTFNATVIVENKARSGGQRFQYVDAHMERYYPARQLLDTGSDADLVSKEYLIRAGFNVPEDLTQIAAGERWQVMGIGNIVHIPEYEIRLRWYRHDDRKVNETRFLVVESTEFRPAS
ncbi:hypothetical protein QBC35DRAFT_478293 [Podospora australis]|uniref:Peptidase A2 domain-containing protein n=1 Tax=Podospora australis TaxID=1536484 RepID=A0AAN6WJK2_9PEZI|nr:hypothetical protein QBC35DRAFT_478293 [Podospora australis]